MANNLLELRGELSAFIEMAEAANNQYFHIETWQLKSVLTGEFLRPDDPDATAQDAGLFEDTGDLSNMQIEAILMRDRGEIPTQNCKPAT